ncbi:MAG: DUF1631 domain-containing protein, partial [Arenimonas sp.]|nr:DUF1631 domain-containing protein [Arenimonas sp.]
TLYPVQAALVRVLGKADDWLFDLAQKEGAVAGSPPLDAMRVLRLSRTPLENAFTRHFEQGFESLLRQIALAKQGGQELSLVEADQLEAQLASEVVVEAITRAHGPALDAVDRRFASMVGVVKLDTGLNPLSASSLANGMQAAQSEISLPDNLRVVLFKIYERELVASLGALLTELNARMTTAGILPELGNPRPTEAAGVAAQIAGAVPQEAPPADDRVMFEALCELLHSWRPQFGGGSISGGAGGPAQGPGGPRRPLALNEMMSVLSLLQPSVPQAVHEAMSNAESSLSQLMKREMMQNTGRIGISADQVNMSAEHEDAVDLVGMLFDVLFDERDFEAQARTLISRLVVPYVKAAVIDRRLFQYKTHPARRLLNSLSEAVEGNKGEGPQEKELLHKAEETVDRLVADFNEDIAIFETLEQELRSFLEQHNRRIELAERRATESQRGQERLEQARTLAAAELSQRIEDRALPAPLNDFLSRSWSHHLSMIALREGADSAAWNAALGVADSLLDLLPKDGNPALNVSSSVQNLREPIENVLASSGITGESASETIRGLAACLESAKAAPARIGGDRPKVVSVAAAAAKPALAIVSDKERLDYDEDDIAVLQELRIGTWLDLAGEDQKLHPAKLSWVSPISSRLMFVNRRGVRILVASVEELAAMKKLGNLVLREQEQVFDQALHRVMGRLQNDVA